MSTEIPNLRVALDWAFISDEAADIEAGLMTAGALWRFWQVTGSLQEGADYGNGQHDGRWVCMRLLQSPTCAGSSLR